MQANFLLGPAGSGKTFRCLAEIRAALKVSPEGPPLILLAPKQATFQLERQLLADPELPGYTRLRILSFERLAQFIFEKLQNPVPDLLSEEGRVMVLRALLGQKQRGLKLFHASARLPGFARKLSVLLRELQRHQLSAARLESLAARVGAANRLDAKLHDLALTLRAYLDWLNEHNLEDADRFLDLASEALKSQIVNGKSKIKLAGLWLDGFAEMTPQELSLLSALVPHCEQATLAFCLEAEPQGDPPWLSTWSVIGQTFRRCRQRLADLSGVEVTVETLARHPEQNRFAQSAELLHLEKSWANPAPCKGTASADSASRIRLVSCSNPEVEATLAAREILRHVRTGGRFREAAVLVRSLDSYADTVRRVFTRYGIPFFLDRREPVAHHPLAELTRYALRLGAFGLRRDDWFGALKTGLASASDEEVDWLENTALEFGWEGDAWLKALHVPDNANLSERAERLRQKLVPPFASLAQQAAAPLDGPRLATAIRDFWDDLDVEKTLEQWNSATLDSAGPKTAKRKSQIVNPIHSTVWEQMNAWLDNLALAFTNEPMELRDWLPILEAGLSTLSVGVIPPALDQVLIGAVDRSRNPDLKLALVLGLNEGVFPAPPALDPLLTEVEREALALHGADLGPSPRHRLGHERYLGYIACTRARERLVLTCAEFDPQGKKLNRSSFFDHIQRFFPDLNIESWQPPSGFIGAEHLSEIIPLAIQLQSAGCIPSGAHGVTRPTESAAVVQRNIGTPTKGARQVPSAPPERGEGQGEEGIQLNLFTTENQEADQTAAISEKKPELLLLPEVADVLAKARQMSAATENQRLSSASVESLFGRELSTSVSALEDFASCPFKFFVGRALRAEERMQFELDARERGSFQHEVLTAFHNELATENRKWRDVSAAKARERVGRIGRELLSRYGHGLFLGDAARRFTGDLLLESLETVIEVLVNWARNYQFDPKLVETGFGLPDALWPAWRVELSDGNALLLRGRIDRVDLWLDRTTGAALAVVMDYKSSSRKPDRLKLHHGLQLQLPTYLAALEQLPEVSATFRVGQIIPAGVFYVNLRGEFRSVKSRAEAFDDPVLALHKGFQHVGRFDESFLDLLDPQGGGLQFNITRRGLTRMNSVAFRELLSRATENLRRLGKEIFSGEIAPAPYRKGNETACDHCQYRSICRFDPWTQPFRMLSEPTATLIAPGEQNAAALSGTTE